ncbi:MAG: SCO2322 family protein [Candidatus Nanopelagicales bacterium]
MTSARRGTAAARAAAVLGVLGGLLVALLVGAPSAEAASYRYWTYWWGQPGSTSWTFAQLGPASDRPQDGSVIGWRFAVTTEAGGKKAPRARLPFSALCPDLTTAAAGEKRVAVVVDYGSASDAPPGEKPPGGGTVRVECVTAPEKANASTVLTTAGVSLRFGSNGLVCGIDGYPRTECAAVVADPTPSPTRTSAKPTPKPTAASSTPAPEPASTAPSATRSSSAAGSSSAPPGSAAATTAGPTSSSAAPEATATEEQASEEPLPVSSGAPVAAGPDDAAASSPVAPLAGVALVLAIGAGAWWTARGRRA